MIARVLRNMTMPRGETAAALASGRIDGIEPSRVPEIPETAAGIVVIARAHAPDVIEVDQGRGVNLAALVIVVARIATSPGCERGAAIEPTIVTAVVIERRTDLGRRVGIEIGTGQESGTGEIAHKRAPSVHVCVIRRIWRRGSKQLSSSERRKPKNISLSRRKPGRRACPYLVSVTVLLVVTDLLQTTETGHGVTQIDMYQAVVMIGSDGELPDLLAATETEIETVTVTAIVIETGTGKERGSERRTETVTETEIEREIATIGHGIGTGTGTIMIGIGITDVEIGVCPHGARDANAAAVDEEAGAIEGGAGARRTMRSN